MEIPLEARINPEKFKDDAIKTGITAIEILQAQLTKAQEQLRVAKEALNWADEILTAIRPFVGYPTPSRFKPDVDTAISKARSAIQQIAALDAPIKEGAR